MVWSFGNSATRTTPGVESPRIVFTMGCLPTTVPPERLMSSIAPVEYNFASSGFSGLGVAVDMRNDFSCVGFIRVLY